MRISDKIKRDIEDIKQASGNPEAVIKLFTDGYCYEFARMLKRWYPSGDIYFLPSESHYIFGIVEDGEDTFWDIRGKLQIEPTRVFMEIG